MTKPTFWGPMSARILWVALIGMAIDQAFKLWMLFGYDITARGRVELTPFLDLVMIWNYGISYGLLQQDGSLGRWLLIAATLVITIVFWIWGARSDRPLQALSLALVIGGALGNGIDRIAYGAVADFFHVHVGDFSWYVFNLADVWIVAGVAGLLYDSFRSGPNDAAKTPSM